MHVLWKSGWGFTGSELYEVEGIKEHIHMLLDTYIVMKTNDRESLLCMMVLALGDLTC